LGCRGAFDENGKFGRLEIIAEDIADAAAYRERLRKTVQK